MKKTLPLVTLALSVVAQSAFAINLNSYNAERHNVFSSGDFSDPEGTTFVRSNAPNFIGAGFDFSGVGWSWGSGMGNGLPVRNLSLLSPLHAIQAAHYPSEPGSTFYFVGANNVLTSNKLIKNQSTVQYAPGHPTGSIGDTTIGTFDRAFLPGEQVSTYRILDVRPQELDDFDIYVYGSKGDLNTGPIIGEARTWGGGVSDAPWRSRFLASSAQDTATALTLGDSGSPGFVEFTHPDGTKELHILGTASTGRSMGSLYSDGGPEGLTYNGVTYYYDPGADINAIMREDGYALKYTIFDDPSNTVNTAAQWTGSFASGNIFASGNWSTGESPHTESVLLDASEANGVTTLNVNQADRVLRGMLFKDSESTEGFTINGDYALTIERVGLRNEASADQTFNADLILGESQNWEAANGGFVFNGGIDTADGHIAVVDGTGDTLINGAVSGDGGLAKSGTGDLTINGVNTNTGNTFIHNGTVQVGESGLLSAQSGVVFTSNDPTARLALDERNQTIGGLDSSHGGTGLVELGGGDLTVDFAGSNNFAGSITGEGSLIKKGYGQLILSGDNSNVGDLIIERGAVRLLSESALSEHSNIRFTGTGGSNGVLELAAGDHDLTLGSGVGEFSIQGNGGFGAYDGDVRVSLNHGDTLDMRSTHFKGLALGSVTSDGTVELTNDIRLGNAFTGSTGTRTFLANDGAAAIDARLSGDLTEAQGYSAGLQLYNGGVLELTGNNSYSGDTTIHSGAIRLGSAGALSANTNLNLRGGVVEFAHGTDDIQLQLGTGAGQVQFGTGGGFSAAGADRSVTLDSGADLTWGVGHFVKEGNNPLKFSTKASDSTVTLTNNVSLGSGSGNRIVYVENGTAGADARMSGNITQESGATRGLTKAGSGTLELTGTNTYTGGTRIEGGALRLGSETALPSSGNTLLTGGVLEYGAGGPNVNVNLGTGAGEVSFINGGAGGFSASGADRTLTLDNGADLVWGQNDFRTGWGDLLLSSVGSDATVTIDNNLSLGSDAGAGRRINVADGSAAVDARLSGNITGTAANIVKAGAGTLELTGSNENFMARIYIEGGALRLGSENAIPDISIEGPDPRNPGQTATFFHQNITLRGGVLELAHSDYTGYIGYARNIFFDYNYGSGGFSAVGEDRTVTIIGQNQQSTTLTWGEKEPLGANYTLLFSSPSADATLIFATSLNMTGGAEPFRTIKVANGSADVDARITGEIFDQNGQYGLIKTGQGTLELTNNNNRYKGETHVKEGRLLIASSQWSAQGDTIVYEDAILGGSGNVGSDVYMLAGSHLKLSDTGPQVMGFYQTLNFEPGAHMHLLLDGGTAGSTNFDYFNVGGGAALIDGAILNVSLAGSFGDQSVVGSVYQFFNAVGGFIGTFEDSLIEVVQDGQLYTFSVIYGLNGGTRIGLQLDSVSMVPEPSNIALLGGLMALLIVRRRS